MKAGDIIALQRNTIQSKIIRIGSCSEWSHVGIATAYNLVLEATLKGKQEGSQNREIREVFLADFIRGHTKLKHLIRPNCLTKEEELSLKKFADFVTNEKRYTVMHAALTLFIRTLSFIMFVIFLFSVHFIYDLNEEKVGSTTTFFLALIYIAAIILLIYQLFKLTFRTKWMVRETEELYRKNMIGRWLVDKKHDMYCSKLVLLADRVVCGPLSKELPNEEEVQPKHIVYACNKLGWMAAEFIHPVNTNGL